jgi:hypothetical protein
VRITVHVNELDQFQELRFQQHATCGVLCTQDKPAVVHFFVQYNIINNTTYCTTCTNTVHVCTTVILL